MFTQEIAPLFEWSDEELRKYCLELCENEDCFPDVERAKQYYDFIKGRLDKELDDALLLKKEKEREQEILERHKKS